jgi:MFS family permease
VRVTPLLAQLVVTLSVAVAVIGVMDTAIYAAIDHIGRSPTFAGVLMSVQGGGSVVGGIAAARVNRRLGEARSAGLGLALVVVGLSLFSLGLLPTLVAAMFLGGVGVPLAFVGLGTAQQLYTPARLQGRVAAAVNLAVSTPQSVFIAVGAGIVAAVGFRGPVTVTAAVCAACALVLLVRPAAPPEVVASLADGPDRTVPVAAGGPADGGAAGRA